MRLFDESAPYYDAIYDAMGKDYEAEARVGKSTARGRISTLEFWYIAATSEHTKCFKESAKFGLFNHAEYLAAFRSAGLKVVYYSKGLMGRGLYVGIK